MDFEEASQELCRVSEIFGCKAMRAVYEVYERDYGCTDPEEVRVLEVVATMLERNSRIDPP